MDRRPSLQAECPLAAFVGTGASIALGVSEDIESLMLMGLMRMGGVGGDM